MNKAEVVFEKYAGVGTWLKGMAKKLFQPKKSPFPPPIVKLSPRKEMFERARKKYRRNMGLNNV